MGRLPPPRIKVWYWWKCGRSGGGRREWPTEIAATVVVTTRRLTAKSDNIPLPDRGPTGGATRTRPGYATKRLPARAADGRRRCGHDQSNVDRYGRSAVRRRRRGKNVPTQTRSPAQRGRRVQRPTDVRICEEEGEHNRGGRLFQLPHTILDKLG